MNRPINIGLKSTAEAGPANVSKHISHLDGLLLALGFHNYYSTQIVKQLHGRMTRKAMNQNDK